MAEEPIRLVPSGALVPNPVPYVIDFSGRRHLADGITYRLGRNGFSGPVALKVASGGATVASRMHRELDVSRFLGPRGGELISKCLGYNFDDEQKSTVVTYRGRPLADIVRDETEWPLGHPAREKVITDLLQGVELLRVSGIVHGSISLNSLHWDGTSLQIIDFGQAALRGRYPDDRPAHHGDDIEAAGRVIYHVHTGQPPPDDPVDLRRQLEHVQDTELRDLLLRRDLVTGSDVDYVFAPERERRPTARVLLDRLDKKPHGVRWEDVVAREQDIRKEFQRLRERQRDFRVAYRRWAMRHPGEEVNVHPPGQQVDPRPPWSGWKFLSVTAVVLAIAALLLVVVLS